jgi:dihydroxyacetone kinase
MLTRILQVVDLPKYAETPKLVLMVNNLGSTTGMEMALVVRRCIQFLTEKGLSITRVLCGSFMTALEMAGVSLTLLPALDADIKR